jgi:uncharacterized DUF497 family protein
MKLTFDPKKDAANVAKHGVSLTMADDLEWETLQCKQDTRRDYGEPRQIGHVMAGDRLYCVVFVDRPADAPTERRIISLRKANNREKESYAAKVSDPQ